MDWGTYYSEKEEARPMAGKEITESSILNSVFLLFLFLVKYEIHYPIRNNACSCLDVSLRPIRLIDCRIICYKS